MNTEIQTQQQGEIIRSEVPPDVIEKLVLYGDISGMQPQEKVTYYNGICKSLGLNPLTQPFAITKLNGKEVMYAKKDCTDQLRRIYGISVTSLTKEQIGDIYTVTAVGCNREGRVDSASGSVSLTGKTGEALANQLMKAESKAKRRLTLSICGLGMLDVTEVEDIGVANAQEKNADTVSLDVIEPTPENKDKFEQMFEGIRQPRVPEEMFGGQSKEEFITSIRNELHAGVLTVEKGNAIYNKVLSYFQ